MPTRQQENFTLLGLAVSERNPVMVKWLLRCGAEPNTMLVRCAGCTTGLVCRCTRRTLTSRPCSWFTRRGGLRYPWHAVASLKMTIPTRRPRLMPSSGCCARTCEPTSTSPSAALCVLLGSVGVAYLGWLTWCARLQDGSAGGLFTPLMLASSCGAAAAVRVLMEYGADPNLWTGGEVCTSRFSLLQASRTVSEPPSVRRLARASLP